MLGKHSKAENHSASASEKRLLDLLHTWRDIEPQADLEEAVWRRIHTAADVQPVSKGLLAWFVPRPVWLSAAAAGIGVVLGVGLAISTSSATDDQHNAMLLRSSTLAGSYLTMVAGVNP